MTRKSGDNEDPRDLMADYLAGRMSEEERQAWERRILEDTELAEALYSDLEVGQALDWAHRASKAARSERAGVSGGQPDTGRPGMPPGADQLGEAGGQSNARRQPDARYGARGGGIRAFPRRRLQWGLGLALPLAAVLAALLLVPRLSTREKPSEDQIFRGDEAALQLIAPVEETVQAPVRFTWSRDAEASSYRFELLDQGLRSLHTAVSTDTALVLGPEVFVSGTGPGEQALEGASRGMASSYFWRVVPLTEIGIERPAPGPTPFTLEDE